MHWHCVRPCDLCSRSNWRSMGGRRLTGSSRCAPSSTEPNRIGENSKPRIEKGSCLAVAQRMHNTCTCLLRYIFLFDKVVIVCKRKGYSYELKEIIELQSYKMSDDPMNNRDVKKVRPFTLKGHSAEWFPLPWDLCESSLAYDTGNESSCAISANVALQMKDLVDGDFRYGTFK